MNSAAANDTPLVPNIPAESQKIIDQAVQLLGEDKRVVVMMLYGLGTVDAICRMTSTVATAARR
jgi:hypothetical protein